MAETSAAEGQELASESVRSGPRREVLIVLPGLMLAMMLAMLDQLIVSTALPRIVGDLGGLSHLSWVVTAYVLASTITTPLYGKLGDLYGRKRLLVIAIVIFLAGSALSGQAHSMDQLIAFRALQGLGAGGLIVGAMAGIGDLVSPRERGQYMGYMMAGMMLSMIAGPLAGGYITDTLNWRWIFYINMPIGGAALIYIIATLRLPVHKIKHKIDYLGAFLLSIAATALVLITTWGGSQYAWGSKQILGLVGLTVVSSAVFVFVESRATEPIIPLHVFKNRNFTLSTSMGFLLGLTMFGAMTFLPLYMQTVQHASPTVSGLLMIPLMLGSTVTSLIAGQLTTRTGRYKALPIVGGGVMTVGLLLLSGLGITTTRLIMMGIFVIFGLGMGFLMQTTTLIVQNSVEPKDMGVASSVRMFFQQVGGSIGVSIFGVVFVRQLTSAIASKLPPGAHFGTNGGQLNPATVMSVPAPMREILFYGISHGIDVVFRWAVPGAIVIFALAWFIKEIPLRSGGSRADELGKSAEEVSELSPTIA